MKEGIKAWKNFLRFWWNFFSVPYLLRTLFSPWKRDITSYPRGFDIKQYAEVFLFNVFSRILGLVVRLITIVCGLIVELIFLILLPLFIISSPILVLYKIQPSKKAFKRFLKKRTIGEKLRKQDLKHLKIWYETQRIRKENQRRFWSYENLSKLGSIGKDWSYGWTLFLDQFCADITKWIQEKGFQYRLISREDEISQIERILARAGENNVLLVGPPGIGRRTIVTGFAQIVLQGKTLNPLVYKRVLELDFDALIAGTKNFAEITGRLKKALNEANRAGNIILVIDQIEGQIDLLKIISSYLGSPNFQLIGITTPQGFHQEFKPRENILQFFEKVEVNEPNENETLLILENVLEEIEKRTEVLFTYQALKEIVQKSNQYILNIPQPEKSVDLLDETSVYVASIGEKIVLPRHVDAIISQKTEIPIGQMALEEREKLLTLEKILHQRIINQAEAVKAISEAMRRARAGIASVKKPIGSFLFLGPTGVGKTQTSKALAAVYFGRETRMIRMDMSEYQEVKAVERMIDRLCQMIEEDPFSLVLLDEIEKAHPDILNLFLQVLDEGRLTSTKGRTVSFRQAIIIATSNAGSELIRKDLEITKDKLLDYLQEKGIFRPEFLNRFDGIILFRPLQQEHLKQIAQLMLDNLTKRLAKEKDIKLEISQELIDEICQEGYSPEYGARPMQRTIQEKVENLIAEKILKGEIKQGDTIRL